MAAAACPDHTSAGGGGTSDVAVRVDEGENAAKPMATRATRIRPDSAADLVDRT